MATDDLKHLLDNNVEWAARIKREDPDFFNKLSGQQAPQYLWIGCSDSRVPANQIVGLLPGEIFVHRNVGNLVIHSDLNCLSVVQFAVDVLKVKHIIVCGHYGCGGVHAALENRKLGLADNWLRIIHDSYLRREHRFQKISDEQRWPALCETNVIDQVRSMSLATVVQDAWTRGQDLTVHGWIYDIADGLLRQLINDVKTVDNLDARCRDAIDAAVARHT
ncbi:MAG: carbonate dehydratase [Alphaproteobacteria bacterium]